VFVEATAGCYNLSPTVRYQHDLCKVVNNLQPTFTIWVHPCANDPQCNISSLQVAALTTGDRPLLSAVVPANHTTITL